MNSLVPWEVMMVVDLDTEPRGSPQILRDPQRSRGCDEPLAVTLGPQTHQAPFGNSGFVTTWVVGRKQDRDIESLADLLFLVSMLPCVRHSLQYD